jgi:hypothetical protein
VEVEPTDELAGAVLRTAVLSFWLSLFLLAAFAAVLMASD